MNTEKEIFNRTERLVGSHTMTHIAQQRVIIFGVGGVGSWCAESLVRTGVRHLTIVDADRVCASNVNRQLMATTLTVGRVKVDALRERLLAINPKADITAVQQIYEEETADRFDLDSFDFVIDAIDSLRDKALLILRASRSRATLFSSMGAALKIDPTRVAVAEFWKVKGCPLGAALRRKFKKQGVYPARKFKCVYSEELLSNEGDTADCDALPALSPEAEGGTATSPQSGIGLYGYRAQINGSLAHITGIFGLTLAGLVVQTVVRQAAQAGQQAQ